MIYNEAYREKSQIIVNVEDILAGDAALININVTYNITSIINISTTEVALFFLDKIVICSKI